MYYVKCSEKEYADIWQKQWNYCYKYHIKKMKEYQYTKDFQHLKSSLFELVYNG